MPKLKKASKVQGVPFRALNAQAAMCPDCGTVLVKLVTQNLTDHSMIDDAGGECPNPKCGKTFERKTDRGATVFKEVKPMRG